MSETTSISMLPSQEVSNAKRPFSQEAFALIRAVNRVQELDFKEPSNCTSPEAAVPSFCWSCPYIFPLNLVEAFTHTRSVYVESASKCIPQKPILQTPAFWVALAPETESCRQVCCALFITCEVFRESFTFCPFCWIADQYSGVVLLSSKDRFLMSSAYKPPSPAWLISSKNSPYWCSLIAAARFWAAMVIVTCAVAAKDIQREVQKSIGLLKLMNYSEIELM